VRITFPVARPVPVQREVEVMKREGERPAWRYFAPSETASVTEATAGATGAKKAARTYSNQDVERQNQKNGEFKYDGKSGKIQ
jgi:hypothetical protein